MKSVWKFLWCVPFVALAACTDAKIDTAAVDKVAADFKAKYNQGKYQAIYQESAPGMKAAIGMEDFDKTLGTVAKVLGNMVSYDKAAISTAKGAKGEDLLMVKYQTQFEKGVGEQVYFLYPNSGAYLLYQWNINSDDLIKGMVDRVQ